MRSRFWAFVAALAICAHGLAAKAESPAEELLKQGAAYMADLESASVRIDITAKMKQGETEREAKAKLFLRWRGDQAMYTELKNDEAQAALITDGSDTYFYNVTEKRYREERSRPRAELMGAYPADIFREGMLWLSGYVHGTEAPEGVTRTHVGEEVLGEGDSKVVCQRVRFESDREVLDAWIEKGERPLPWRIEVDYAKSIAEMEGQNVPESAVALFEFSDWVPEADLDAEIFAFKAPEGVAKDVPAAGRPPRSHPLVGQVAPALALPLLEGGEMTLANHKDKQVVVLDFWATWCGPCRIGLPMVSQAAETLKDADVAFYAVNLQESPEQVKPFMASLGLSLTVAMDLDGRAGEAYGAYSIPQTVIVGKDGVVKQVHQGVMPGYGERLVAEVRELLAGE